MFSQLQRQEPEVIHVMQFLGDKEPLAAEMLVIWQ